MYILKNAARNAGCNILRSIAAGAVMLAVIAVSSSALAINRAAGRVVEQYRKAYGSIVTISPDIDKLMGNGKSIHAVPGDPEPIQLAGITPGQYSAFARSDYLEASVLVTTMPVVSSAVKAVGQGNAAAAAGEDATPGGDLAAAPVPALTLVGNSDTANLEGFRQGRRKMTQGRMYRNDGECIISSDLASLNRLGVSDVIVLDGLTPAKSQPEYRFTVTGIYEDTAQTDGDAPSAFPGGRNEILTTFEAVAGQAGSGASIQALYYLKSPDLLDAYAAELRRDGLPEGYAVSEDKKGFDAAAGAVEGLRNLSLAAAVTAVALGAAGMAAVAAAGLKKRRQEIAALRVMGMKKRNVARSLVYEALLIAFASLILGAALGAVLAQPAADMLLSGGATAGEREESINVAYGAGMVFTFHSGLAGDVGASMQGLGAEPVGSIAVPPDAAALLQAAAVALVLAAVAAFVALRFVGRNDPMNAVSEKR